MTAKERAKIVNEIQEHIHECDRLTANVQHSMKAPCDSAHADLADVRGRLADVLLALDELEAA